MLRCIKRIKWSVLFSLFIAVSTTISNVSQAENDPSGEVDGIPIPYNGTYPDAQYPYYSVPNGCGSPGPPDTSWVPEKWGAADFTEACDYHDSCYMTLGENKYVCDEKFFIDMQSACFTAYAPDRLNNDAILSIGTSLVSEYGGVSYDEGVFNPSISTGLGGFSGGLASVTSHFVDPLDLTNLENQLNAVSSGIAQDVYRDIEDSGGIVTFVVDVVNSTVKDTIGNPVDFINAPPGDLLAPCLAVATHYRDGVMVGAGDAYSSSQELEEAYLEYVSSIIAAIKIVPSITYLVLN